MTTNPEPVLTICTVSFGHKYLIEENMRFANELNPTTSINWIIVENTPKENRQRFDIEKLEKVRIIEGIKNSFTGIGVASQHHGSGLNMAIREVDTRFALVLDPDFYIVRKNWVREIIEHMDQNKLTFFGAPYNPKRYLKYRYFPCVHCMFIDLEKVTKADLNFSPKYE